MKSQKGKYGEMEDKLSDSTPYGEFISTYHHWISLEEQKNRAAELQNLGSSKK